MGVGDSVMPGDAARPRVPRNDVRTLSDALAIDNQLASAALDRVRSLKTKLTKVSGGRKRVQGTLDALTSHVTPSSQRLGREALYGHVHHLHHSRLWSHDTAFQWSVETVA